MNGTTNARFSAFMGVSVGLCAHVRYIHAGIMSYLSIFTCVSKLYYFLFARSILYGMKQSLCHFYNIVHACIMGHLENPLPSFT